MCFSWNQIRNCTFVKISHAIKAPNLINRVSILFRPVDSHLNLNYDDKLALVLALTNSFDSDTPFHYTVALPSILPAEILPDTLGNGPR